jgi:ABC-type glycerol-3-phosphate transport system permease component
MISRLVPSRAHRPRAANPRVSLAAELTLAAAMLVIIAPVVWLVVLAAQPQADVVSAGWRFGFTTRNVTSLFGAGEPYVAQFTNSVIIVVGTVALCLGGGSLAGYSLSRLGWSRRTTVTILGATGLITVIPPMTLVPGLYVTLNSVGVLGSVAGLIFLNTVFNLPFATVLMKVYFDRVPGELREAALIDGASEARTFARIMLPLAAPGAAAVAIFVAIMSWNEFLFGLTMTAGGTTAPLTVGIAGLVQPEGVPRFGEMAAMGAIMVMPVLVIAAVANRWIVAAISQGAVKG